MLAVYVISTWEGILSLTTGSGNVAAIPQPSVGDTVTLPFDTRDTLDESANLVVALPPSKSQCKHGGWKSFGGRFRNQGDCVSFIATGGRNQPSGT
jgi:hypothetical protein